MKQVIPRAVFILWATASLLVLLGTQCPRALAIERLPEQIPSLAVEADRAVQEAVRSAARIEQQSERQKMVTRILYDVRDLAPAKVQPFVAILRQELAQLDDKRKMLASGEALYHLEPAFVLDQCRQIDEDATRDRCLRYYIQASQGRSAAELRPLMEEVKDPAMRADCAAALARNRQASLEEIRGLWRERKKVAGPASTSQDIYSLAGTLERFADRQFDEVIEFARNELTPDEAVRTLAILASRFDHAHKSPEKTTRLFREAAEVVPACANPAEATTTLLHAGLAKRYPQRALALFDKHLEPALTRSAPDSVLPGLVPAGLELALERSDRISARLNLPKEMLAARMMGRVASSDPTAAMAWLKAAPDSAFRDAAVKEIAQGLWSVSLNGRADPGAIQQWVDALADAVPAIDDVKLRASACEAIHTLARRSGNGSSATIPKSIRDEYARMWRQIAMRLEPDQRMHRLVQYTSLLSLDIQQDGIDRALREGKTRIAAALVRGSSLGADQKRRWYGQIIEQARDVPDLPQRSATLAGISRCLQEVDPDLALRVLWEGLKIAQDLGLKQQYHDVGDSLGSMFPYVTPDECLRSTIDNLPSEPAKTIQALWSFARTLEAPGEREAMLETVVELLLRQNETRKAAGVADLFNDPARRAKVWGAVAIVTSGKPLRTDW